MSSTRVFNRSFFGGIVSPELFSRIDLDKFVNGLRDCINMIPLPHGPVKRRPGRHFVNRSKNPVFRLIPFVYASDQALILELGHHYLRLHTSGGAVLENPLQIASITESSSAVFSVTGDMPVTFGNDNWVFIDGIAGSASCLNGSFWEVFNFDQDSQSFMLRDPYSGENVNTIGLSGSGGNVARVYEASTPFDEEDIFDLSYTQSLDVVTVSHKNYSSVEISRYAATDWRINDIVFGSAVAFDNDPLKIKSGDESDPISVTTNASQVSPDVSIQAYVVTAVVNDEETLACRQMICGSVQILGAGYDGDDYYIYIATSTVTGVPQVAGEIIYISWVNQESLHDNYFVVGKTAVSGGNTWLYLSGIEDNNQITTPGLLSGPVSGSVAWVYLSSLRSDLSVLGRYNSVSWKAIDGAQYYNVYKMSETGNIFGFAGRVNTNKFVDKNIVPDITQSPPIDTNYFSNGNNPCSVGVFEQRRVFGGTLNNPQTVYISKSGFQKNFSQSLPLQSDDAIIMRMIVGQQNSIRHILSIHDLVLLTAGSAIRVYSTSGDAISNDNIMPRPLNYGGANMVNPVLAKSGALFASAVGGHVNEIVYTGDIQGYQINDVSVIAPHLFDDYSIVDMAYSRAPVSCVWVVRNDGELLSFTYLPEQRVTAWARHTSAGGLHKTAAVIPENNLDALYVGVVRKVGGIDVGFIERMSNIFSPTDRQGGDYIDCSLSYSGDPVSEVGGLWHLEGCTVSVLADGGAHPDVVVSGGMIELDYPASNVRVGFCDPAGIDLLPVYVPAPAYGSGTMKNTTRAWVRVDNSAGFKIGPYPGNEDSMTDTETANVQCDGVAPLNTAEIECPVIPGWARDGSLSIRVDDPLPITILSVAIEVQLAD